jgi:hypothetical protein
MANDRLLYSDPTPSDPRINFAPVIKIFSGEGNKDMSQTRPEGNYMESSDELIQRGVQNPTTIPEIPELDFSKPIIIEKSKN